MGDEEVEAQEEQTHGKVVGRRCKVKESSNSSSLAMFMCFQRGDGGHRVNSVCVCVEGRKLPA